MFHNFIDISRNNYSTILFIGRWCIGTAQIENQGWSCSLERSRDGSLRALLLRIPFRSVCIGKFNRRKTQ